MRKSFFGLLIITLLLLCGCEYSSMSENYDGTSSSFTVEPDSKQPPDFDASLWYDVIVHDADNEDIGAPDLNGMIWLNTPVYIHGTIEKITDNGTTVKLLGFDSESGLGGEWVYYFISEIQKQFAVNDTADVIFDDETLIRSYKDDYEAYTYTKPDERYISVGMNVAFLVNSFGSNHDIYSDELRIGKSTEKDIKLANEYINACFSEYQSVLKPASELPFATVRIDDLVKENSGRFYHIFNGTIMDKSEDLNTDSHTYEFYNLIYRLPNDDKTYLDSPSESVLPEGTVVKIYYYSEDYSSYAEPVAMEVIG